ncbi:MAG: hypothetical protein M1837_005519 [Sclerophora amabilis]|nr:MAG: hypothetical protein M1837_005519 [Sclerophora amabilis]
MTSPSAKDAGDRLGGANEQQKQQQKQQQERRRPASSSSAAGDPSLEKTSGSPKKRRKVNHGHLCHDEPREPVKKTKSEQGNSAAEEDESSPKPSQNSPANGQANSFEPRAEPEQQQQQELLLLQESGLPLGPPQAAPNRMANSSGISQPSPVSGSRAQPLDPNDQQYLGYNEWGIGLQNQLQDINSIYPSSMFNAPEVTNEYNLLNDFLSNSLIDDGTLYSAEEGPGVFSDPSAVNTMPSNVLGPGATFAPAQPPSQLPLPSQASSAQGNVIPRPVSTAPSDKARETYYMTAADPSGNESPEERMNKLLKAKYDAGLLRPFNYVKGYSRLSQYMEKNIQPASRQKILRQLEKFRPKFRERMQKLTDIELVVVEMWFERTLMEYDRVFASMAIPACCWRRTGEIFRGNKEMAELVHVPIDRLRDGKVAIHEIFEEESLVSYWEKFGTIAFDNAQKAMLTSCLLKNPDPKSNDASLHCCFSFTIRRDSHNMLVGLPILI